MREIRILVDEEKHTPLGDELFARFLQAQIAGTASKEDFEHFRDLGLTVTVDGFPAHAEATEDERAMQPLWNAVNTISGRLREERVELRQRWLLLAREAAMTAIHRVQQAERGDTVGQWPMDEFLHSVWSLLVAMQERIGDATAEPWFGQEFGFVVEALRARGLQVVNPSPSRPDVHRN